MSPFSTNHLPFPSAGRYAVWLLCAGLTAGAWAVAATRPALAAGAWPQSEAVTVVVQAGAALCLAGLSLTGSHGGAILRSPLITLPLALALWSAFSSAFALFPGTALLGAPQNGLGALWFVAQAAFTAAALTMRRHCRTEDLTAGFVAAATLLAVICNLRHLPWLQPLLARHDLLVNIPAFSFNEYLAYPALALSTVGLARWNDGRRKAAIILLLIAGVTLVAARNRSALAAIAVILPLGALLWKFRPLAVHAPLSRRAILGLTATIIAASAAPLLVLWFADLSQMTFSLRSRQVLAQVLGPSLIEPPSALLVGHGWGHYQEYLARNIADTGIPLFQSWWSDLSRDEFHSHNALLETFFATGLPGTLLSLAFSVFIVVQAAPRHRIIALGFVLTGIVVDSLWFSLPLALPAQALALAALTDDDRAPRRPVRRAPFLALTLTLAVTLALAAAWQRHHSLAVEGLRTCLHDQDCHHPTLPADPHGSESGLAALLGEFNEIPTSAALPALLDATHSRCRSGCALMLSIRLLDWQGRMAFATPDAPPFSAALWREEAERILARAPQRQDLLTPYCNWLLAREDYGALKSLLEKMKEAAPAHPVALWFDGILLLGRGGAEQNQGLEQMRKALESGLERFMPVPDEVKRPLLGQS